MSYLEKLKSKIRAPGELSELPEVKKPENMPIPTTAKSAKRPFDGKDSTRTGLFFENKAPTNPEKKRCQQCPQIVTPAMVGGWRVGRKWILDHLSGLEQSGWTRHELFRAGRFKYPMGSWGAAWFWPEGEYTVSLESDGAIRWTWKNANEKVVSQAMRPRTPQRKERIL